MWRFSRRPLGYMRAVSVFWGYYARCSNLSWFVFVYSKMWSCVPCWWVKTVIWIHKINSNVEDMIFNISIYLISPYSALDLLLHFFLVQLFTSISLAIFLCWNYCFQLYAIIFITTLPTGCWYQQRYRDLYRG